MEGVIFLICMVTGQPGLERYLKAGYHKAGM